MSSQRTHIKRKREELKEPQFVRCKRHSPQLASVQLSLLQDLPLELQTTIMHYSFASLADWATMSVVSKELRAVCLRGGNTFRHLTFRPTERLAPQLLKLPPSSIRKADLSRGRTEKKINDCDIVRLVSLPAAKALETLDLSGCAHITDRSLQALATLPKLRTLNLAWCTNITDSGICALALTSSSSPGLTELNIKGCSRVTDKGVASLANNQRLSLLDLSHTGEGLTGSSIGTLTSLTTLVMESCRFVTDSGVQQIASLPQLSSLSISWCNQLTNQAFAYVAASHSLRYVSIKRIELLTNCGLSHLQKNKSLRKVSLASCDLVTDDAIDKLTQATATNQTNHSLKSYRSYRR